MSAKKVAKRRAARAKLKAHDHGLDRHNKGLAWIKKQNRQRGIHYGGLTWARGWPKRERREPSPLTYTIGDVMADPSHEPLS